MSKNSLHGSGDGIPSGAPISLKQLLKLLSPVFFRHRYRLLLGFLALLSVDFLQLIIPRFIKYAVDGLDLGTANQDKLLTLAFAVVLAALGVAVFRFIWRYMIIGFSRILERDLRNRLFSHVLKMDQPFFEKWTTGDLMAHASNDLNAIQMACGMGMVASVDAFIMSTAAICFMMAINIKLTLIALIPMPVLAIGTRVLSGRLHHRFNLVQEQFSLLTEFSRSVMSSIKLVQAYTLEKFQERQFEILGKAYVSSNLKVAFIQGLIFPIATLVGNTGMLLVLFFGGSLVISGVITLGDFAAFVTYLYMLIWPMMAVGWVVNLAQRGITSLRRINTLLSETNVVKQLPLVGFTPTVLPTFKCKNLNFTYSGAKGAALKDINLEISPGLLGITGRTGSGKSTLCKLLLRMYDVEDGSLFFHGQDVNFASISKLRQQLAYAGQESQLFSHSITENIGFGNLSVSINDIQDAAKAAGIHDDILSFPKGYDSLVGERGIKLSGGQKQRLALARALIMDRPVLIIDDALSAIDVETEQDILQSMEGKILGKTVILVSHRVNVLRHANEILVLEQGRLTARGTHEQLLATNGFYQSITEKQLTDA